VVRRLVQSGTIGNRVRVTLWLTASQSSQYVSVSSPLCGRLTRYCFLFKGLGLEFVLCLWGALSDKRPGLALWVYCMSQSHFTADSHSVCLGVEPTLWTFDQILLPVQVFGSEICCLVSVGRPLWREAESGLCMVTKLVPRNWAEIYSLDLRRIALLNFVHTEIAGIQNGTRLPRIPSEQKQTRANATVAESICFSLRSDVHVRFSFYNKMCFYTSR
jgi:hypothetical protein